jgi:hypothetical protein
LDIADAVDRVREKLEASFGKAMTMMIMAAASNMTGTSTLGMDDGQYAQFVECVCRDQRVVDMWGARGAGDALSQWKAFV